MVSEDMKFIFTGAVNVFPYIKPAANILMERITGYILLVNRCSRLKWWQGMGDRQGMVSRITVFLRV